jgi:hypothetical protein
MDDRPNADAVGRSRVLRRAILGEHHERFVVNDPRRWAVERRAATSVIVQRLASRSRRDPFVLMFFDGDNSSLRMQDCGTLALALEAAADVAAIRPEDWQIVSEPFGSAPMISAELLLQVTSVAPTRDGMFEYRPSRVRLRDGTWRDGVYVQDLETYLDEWGIPPGTSRGRYELAFGDVVEIADSPRRLPPHIAKALYDAGESAMGGCYFVLVTGAGLRIPCQTGNFVDFIDLPINVDPADIVRVEPHAKEARTASNAARTLDIRWSIYTIADLATKT